MGSSFKFKEKNGSFFGRGHFRPFWIKGSSLLFLLLSCFFLRAGEETLSFTHYTNEDGLPSSYVKSIVQDAEGFMWFATRSAVTRFDGREFKEFPVFDHNDKEVSLFSDRLFLSPDSVLIARTINEKYYYFDVSRECFYPYDLLNNIGSTQSIVSTSGGYWICRNNNVFFLYQNTGEKKDILDIFSYARLPDDVNFLNIIKKNDRIIILGDDNSLFSINTNNRSLKRFDLPENLIPSLVRLYFVDSHEHAWIGEYENGLLRLDLESGDYQMYASDRSLPERLPHNLVHSLTEDRQGRVWIGTEGGIALMDPEKKGLENHCFSLDNSSGLNSNPIYDAYCDKHGNVWLGTYFGGINLWSNEDVFFETWSPGLGKKQLRGNVVSCLEEDVYGNLWIGLEDNGLNKFNRETGSITHFTAGEDDQSLSYENLHDLHFVSDHELWIATYTGGINILNTKTEEIRHLGSENTPGLPSDAVYSFMPVGDSIFISTSEGISIYNKQSRSFSRLMPETLGSTQFESMDRTGDKLWFSSGGQVYCCKLGNDALFTFDKVPEMSNINFVKSDSEGNVWLGDCYEGLCRYDETNDSIKFFNTDTGFPVSWIFSLEEGADGWYWASSDKGLVKFHPEKEISVLYDNNSGIPFNQFNYRASFIDSRGNIYFGGNNGMVSFNEQERAPEQRDVDVMFTGMQLFNKPVSPVEDDVLEESINQTDEIILNYNQNVLTLEYTAFSYASEGQCQYAYYLEGFEEEWNYVGNRNFATYTNLSPGTYTFHVKASLQDIQSATNDRVLRVIVRPPFWLSKWAFVIYFVLALSFSFLVLKVGKNLERSKAMLAMERREREHADEIYRVKLDFFTNISHELKTPLTLILGPLNNLMDNESIPLNSKKCLKGIERNANRLFQLINQLLEFRKIEDGKEELKISRFDMVSLLENVKSSFSEVAKTRGIEFSVEQSHETLDVWMDVDKVDKIIFNLLSNAFKFSDKGDHVKLDVSVEGAETGNQTMTIRVADTGIGIHPEKLKKVFDRFFRLDSNHDRNSGIGLAFVHSLVSLHKGSIDVKSEKGRGTEFTVILPASREVYPESQIIAQPNSTDRISTQVVEEVVGDFRPIKRWVEATDSFSQKPVIFVVEDNFELVTFLKEILEEKYRVVTATNGAMALEKMENVHPDLIVSDIMMPVMDGIEFTNKIKTDLNYSHIPVILLTSKSGYNNEIAGLKTGADYYIEKPFYPHMLEQIIENSLNTRNRTIERFKDDTDTLKISEMAHSDSDKVFFEKLVSVIKANITNTSMDVTFLLNEMGVSRSLLHLKLKKMVGCSSTEFIRVVRLKEASRLITSGQCNISQAAYETGFSSPTYFTRCFKEYFGKSPREYFALKTGK